MFDAFDKLMMERALNLAWTPVRPPYPNPRVGAVIARDGKVLAEGMHASYDSPHAEYAALASIGFSAPGATIYVTLEPCCPFAGKRNPSCAELIVKAGITRVVVAVTHPEDGEDRGCAIVRDAGLALEAGLMEEEASWAMRGIFHHRHTGRPYVLAKWAMTADGLIAPPDRTQGPISCPEGFALLHQLRHFVDGVMIGIGTALNDNPRLDCRYAGFRHPVRVLVDPKLRIRPDMNIANPDAERRSLVLHGPSVDVSKQELLASRGVELAKLPVNESGRFAVADILEALVKHNILTVLLEGGAGLHGEFFDARAVDEYHILVAPMVMGGSNSLPPVGGRGTGSIERAVELAGVKHRTVGTDLLITGFPVFDTL